MCFCSIEKVSTPSFSTETSNLWSRLHLEDSTALEQRRSWVQQVELSQAAPGENWSHKKVSFIVFGLSVPLEAVCNIASLHLVGYCVRSGCDDSANKRKGVADWNGISYQVTWCPSNLKFCECCPFQIHLAITFHCQYVHLPPWVNVCCMWFVHNMWPA